MSLDLTSSSDLDGLLGLLGLCAEVVITVPFSFMDENATCGTNVKCLARDAGSRYLM